MSYGPMSEHEAATLLEEVRKLRAFKRYVHERLDQAGVPADPESEQNAKHGCRIEGRLNFVLEAALARDATAQKALAESQAREQALRAALRLANNLLREKVAEYSSAFVPIDIALAAPTDATALRELLFTAVCRAIEPRAPHLGIEALALTAVEVVDAVLSDAWSAERIVDTGDGPHVTQIGSEPMPKPKGGR